MLRYPSSQSGVAIEASEDLLHELAILRDAKREIAIQEGIADKAMLAIKGAMATAETLSWQGETLATWKSARPSVKTDWKAVASDLEVLVAREQFNAALAAHTATTDGSRRFLVKAEK